MNQQIHDYLEDVQHGQKAASVPEDVRLAVRHVMRQTQPLIEQISGPNEHERFLGRYVRQAAAQLRAGEREQVCQCRRPSCKLKRGVLPATVTDEPTIGQGIDRWNRRHSAPSPVLAEGEAQYRQYHRTVQALVTTAADMINDQAVYPVPVDGVSLPDGIAPTADGVDGTDVVLEQP